MKEKSLRTRLKWNLFALLAGLLIVYVGLQLLSRTEGARAAVADKISNATRQTISIGSCAATPLLGLRLQELDFANGQMSDFRAWFNGLSWMAAHAPLVARMDIYGVDLRFDRSAQTGGWEPAVLNGVAAPLGAALGATVPKPKEAAAPPRFRSDLLDARTVLRLRRVRMAWHDEQGKELASLIDADADVKRVMFGDHQGVQAVVKCGQVRLASGRLLHDFRIEAVKIDGYKPVIVLGVDEGEKEYEGFQTTNPWPDLQKYLESLGGG